MKKSNMSNLDSLRHSQWFQIVNAMVPCCNPSHSVQIQTTSTLLRPCVSYSERATVPIESGLRNIKQNEAAGRVPLHAYIRYFDRA